MRPDASGKDEGWLGNCSLVIAWGSSGEDRVCLKRTLSTSGVGDFDELTEWLISGEISTKTGCCFNKTYTICSITLDPRSGWQVNCYRSLEKY